MLPRDDTVRMHLFPNPDQSHPIPSMTTTRVKFPHWPFTRIFVRRMGGKGADVNVHPVSTRRTVR